MDKSEQQINVENSGVLAKKIDSVTIYTTSTIKSSILASLLKIMIDEDSLNENNTKKPNLETYDIEAKIKYNNVIKYNAIIEKYYSYCSICQDTLNKLDDIKPRAKSKILNAINDKYLLLKGELLKDKVATDEEIDIIRKNADIILDNIKEYYLTQAKITESLNAYDLEEIGTNIIAFIVYCFVECKILERPPMGE